MRKSDGAVLMTAKTTQVFLNTEGELELMQSGVLCGLEKEDGNRGGIRSMEHKTYLENNSIISPLGWNSMENLQAVLQGRGGIQIYKGQGPFSRGPATGPGGLA